MLAVVRYYSVYEHCGRFGLIFGRFGLWPFWCVAVLVVAVLVYGRFGRHPLKLAGVPQTTGSISTASLPKFSILRGHVEDILLLNKFFFEYRYVP